MVVECWRPAYEVLDMKMDSAWFLTAGITAAAVFICGFLIIQMVWG
jgi:hypothetical protein